MCALITATLLVCLLFIYFLFFLFSFISNFFCFTVLSELSGLVFFFLFFFFNISFIYFISFLILSSLREHFFLCVCVCVYICKGVRPSMLLTISSLIHFDKLFIFGLFIFLSSFSPLLALLTGFVEAEGICVVALTFFSSLLGRLSILLRQRLEETTKSNQLQVYTSSV